MGDTISAAADSTVTVATSDTLFIAVLVVLAIVGVILAVVRYRRSKIVVAPSGTGGGTDTKTTTPGAPRKPGERY